jgi:aspartyl protease family protein
MSSVHTIFGLSAFDLSEYQIGRIAIGVILILILLPSLLTHFRGRWTKAPRYLLIWGLLLLAIVAGHAYQHELSSVAGRVIEDLVPGTVVAPVEGEVIVTRRMDRQFQMKAVVNGVTLPFLFDTGATTVTIRAEDADRLGIATDQLLFNVPISTANGRTLAASTMIETLSVGGITERRIQALVAKFGTLGTNLLGQNFLERLSSYRVENDRLIMRSNRLGQN